MGYIDSETMIALRDKMIGQTDQKIKDALTPAPVGQAKTIADVDHTEHNGIIFNIGDDWKGLYVFTYGYCMIPLFVYGLSEGVVYKTSATLLSSGGEYKVKVLSYYIRNKKLIIYQGEDYIPVGYDGYLFKIKLY